MKTINIQHPGRFLKAFDPRKIQTLGDQVIAEHVLGFHIRNSPEGGMLPLLSEVKLDRAKKHVEITPRFPLKTAEGKEFSLEDICQSMIASFRGTAHSHFGDIITKVECKKSSISFDLKAFPVNLPFLLGTPDFAISDPKYFPAQDKYIEWSTGPYFIADRQMYQVTLRRNPHYPPELNANSAEEIVYKTYFFSEVAAGLKKWDPKEDHLIYLPSPGVSSAQLDELRSAGYNLRVYPNEGLLYLSFFKEVELEAREAIFKGLEDVKAKLIREHSFLQAAFSMFPSDREFGLSEKEYREALDTSPVRNVPLKKKLILGVTPESYGVPALKAICDALTTAFPGIIELRLYPPGTLEKFMREVDMSVDYVGLSPSDPLSHLYYMRENEPHLTPLITEEELRAATYEEDSLAFTKKIKALELKLAKKRSFFPVAHYPGIVAESPILERVDELSWSWGAPAWSYRVR